LPLGATAAYGRRMTLHLPRMTATALALLATSALAAPTAAAEAAQPSPGAAGIGDRLFPTLGNGGYDVSHYDLDLRYATSAPAQSIDGTVTILAKATHDLSSFNLDFAGKGVGAVAVDGSPARWRRAGEELVITPESPLLDGQSFEVRVGRFSASPTAPNADELLSSAFFTTRDGSATAGQPDSAHVIYPSNDHPRDKASFDFRFDVPAGTTAVANGVLTGRKTSGDRESWSYRQRQPMATELTQLAVGNFEVTSPGSRPDVVLRDVTPRRLTASLKPKLAPVVGHLDWMESRVGRYPFDAYGSLVVDERLGFALETQTLSLFDTALFALPRGLWDPVMVHELAHQWFGDSVSPSEWSDLWLNEGHASWYEFTYAAEKGFLDEDTGVANFEELMRLVYSAGDEWRAEWGPVAQPGDEDPSELFSPNVYAGGALVLYALRQEIGEAGFRRVEREWVERYRDKSPSTADFIALASEVAGRDLTAFLRAWLYDTETPPMPGRPSWRVEPVEDGVPALRALELVRRLSEGRRH
jgi:aminopeptidase N